MANVISNSFNELDKIVNKTLKNLREELGDIPGEDPNIIADEEYERFESSVRNALRFEFKSNPGFEQFCDQNGDIIDQYTEQMYKPNMDVYEGGEAVDDVVDNVLQEFEESKGEYDDMEQRNDMEQAFQSGEYSALEEGKKNKAKSQINEVKRMKLLAGLIKENQDWKGFNPEETAAALDQAGIKYKKDNYGGFIITRMDGQTAEIGDGGYGGYSLYTSDNKIHQERSDQTIEDIMDALIPWFNN